MSKILRKTMKLFGASSPSQVGQFGSFAAGSVATSTDPSVIQSLGAWVQGWFSAIVGGQNPALEDRNGVDYVMSYGNCYLHQTGVAEWDAGTTYFTGSLVNDSAGNLYASLTDNNLNNALAVGTNWRRVGNPNVIAIDPGATPSYTITAADIGKTFEVNTANGQLTLTLPSGPPAHFWFSVKDSAGYASAYPVKVQQPSGPAMLIEGVQAAALMGADWGSWSWECDGTNWVNV